MPSMSLSIVAKRLIDVVVDALQRVLIGDAHEQPDDQAAKFAGSVHKDQPLFLYVLSGGRPYHTRIIGPQYDFAGLYGI